MKCSLYIITGVHIESVLYLSLIRNLKEIHPLISFRDRAWIIMGISFLTNFVEQFQFVGTVVPQWLRCCATNRKIAGSIPDRVIGIFH